MTERADDGGGGFPADTLARLARKRYMQPAPRHGATAINVLTLGFGERVAAFFTACRQTGDTSGGNVRRRLFQCGDVTVEDLSSLPLDGHRSDAELEAADQAALAEEVGIAVRGERARFGAEMRASGWFSGGVLGRRYARETATFETRPHAILGNGAGASLLTVAKSSIDAGDEVTVRIVSTPADAREAAEAVADMLHGRHMNARAAAAFRQGARAGYAAASGDAAREDLRDAYEAELRARPVVRETVVVRMPAAPQDAAPTPLRRRATDCEAALADVLRQLDATRAEHKKALSAAFESGVRNAKEVV